MTKQANLSFALFLFLGGCEGYSPTPSLPKNEQTQQPGASQAQVAKSLEPKEQQRTPASVAEAAQVIDLSAFPQLPNVVETNAKSVALLEYVVRLDSFDVNSEYEFQRRNLLERQWKELPDGDGQFTRAGFHLYVTVQLHDEPTKAIVRLENNGNVDVNKLPVPRGAIFRETNYNVASYETTSNAIETREAVRELLIEQGWQPYGTRGDAMDMKQNAVLLTAAVTDSTRSGKTQITYWTRQMSAELPSPPNSESILYGPDYNELELIAFGSRDEITLYYETVLARQEWKAALEKPSHNGRIFRSPHKDVTFHNPNKDVLRLGIKKLNHREGHRVTLKYLSAAEIEAAEQNR